jgi:glyoxylate carboligase
MKKPEDLIKEYQLKIARIEINIDRITKMIKTAEVDATIDVEDLKEERINARHDRQIYFQFTKDLEDLI